MAGTLVCRTSDCVAGLQQQSLYDTDSEGKTGRKLGQRGTEYGAGSPSLNAILKVSMVKARVRPDVLLHMHSTTQQGALHATSSTSSKVTLFPFLIFFLMTTIWSETTRCRE